ncbi:MAG: threonine/serine exporter family protein, partial [Planctomycetota bacterium]
RHQFLIEAAIKLHRYGTPSHRLERVLTDVATSLGTRGDFLYTPTGLAISLTDVEGERNAVTVVRRVDAGGVDVDKLIQFDRLLSGVQSKAIGVPEAIGRLEEIEAAPPLYSNSVLVVACAVASACVAILFRCTLSELVAAFVVGGLVAIIELTQPRWKAETGLLEPIAGMAAALASLLIARFLTSLDDRLVTLAGLIVLIPGLRFTVAMTELAVGHLSAGVARLAGSLVSLSTLFVGVAMVWRLMDGLRPAFVAAMPLGEAWRWIALAIAPISFAIIFRARVQQWPIISLVAVTGVGINWLAEPVLGIEIAAFSGALTVGCASNLYARLRDLPALVPLTPGMLILVPGSLGYRSLTALLERQVVDGVQYGFTMFMIAVSLVGGLLVSNVVVPPKRIL